MAKKDKASYEVTFELDDIAGLSVAERKNAINLAFDKAKDKAISDLAKKLQ